jgi:membrane-associated PAP2 superfamily phosphatase
VVCEQRRTLIASLAGIIFLLCLVIVVARATDIDRQISNAFFEPVTGQWLVDHDSSRLRLWFYDGPKLLIIAFGLLLASTIIRPSIFPAWWFTRRESFFVFACLAAIPLAVGTVKKNSNVVCPIELQQYGGTESDDRGHVSLAGFLEMRRYGGCWPSGHASGGFALLCLALLDRPRRIRRRFVLLGLTAGLSMGIYQVARGAHFTSHVLITGLIAVLLAVVLAPVFGVCGQPGDFR